MTLSLTAKADAFALVFVASALLPALAATLADVAVACVVKNLALYIYR
jgi:hypothetical protein